MFNQYENIDTGLINNPNLTVAELDKTIREIEKELYGANYLALKDPTFPQSVLRQEFSNTCAEYSEKLVELLADRSIFSIQATSSEENGLLHLYAVLYTSEGLKILDPSLPQFAAGITGVKIASRAELKRFIENLNNTIYCADELRQEQFLRSWGNQSKSFHTRRLIPEVI